MKKIFTLTFLGFVPFMFADYYQSGGNYQGGQPSYSDNSNQGGYYSDNNSGYPVQVQVQQQPYSGRNDQNYQQSNNRPYVNYENAANQNGVTVTYKVADQDNTKDYTEADLLDSEKKFPQDSAASPRDRQLNAKIRNKLSGWFSKGYEAIILRTSNGVVAIIGTVDNDSDFKNLDEKVKGVEGVRTVQNQVGIKNKADKKDYSESDLQESEKKYPQDSAANLEDRQLNAKIRNKITGWFTKGYDALVLRTSNGIVVISGFVENDDESKKVEDKIKGVEGVRAVQNQVSVKK